MLSRHVVTAALLLLAACGRDCVHAPANTALPTRLADTGLYADFEHRTLAPGVLPFAPQYALWSDGARKQRWIRLPPGTFIDARDPDRFRFPVGTALWKEFAFDRRIETRHLRLGEDGVWRYGTYVWTADGRDAVLAPERGVPAAGECRPGVPYDVPGVADCRACHEGHPVAVLGFGALQLSSDRDPLAPHAEPLPPDAVDLAVLVDRGLVRNLPPASITCPPRVRAGSARARAALGYLHGNCASCHNADGPLRTLGLSLEQRVGDGVSACGPSTTAIDAVSRYQPYGRRDCVRIASGDPDHSLLVQRLASRQPLLQMPPLGTRLVDEAAVALVRAWITELGPAPSVPGQDVPRVKSRH